MNAMPMLPPTARDFEIQRMSLVQYISTRTIAEKHRISQTRVRQIIKRVCDWLAAALPVKTEAQQEQEARLAQHLAADQLRHQIDQLQIFWNATSDPKYLRQQTRVIASLSRLAIVPGTIDALAADATEGPESTSPPSGDCSPSDELQADDHAATENPSAVTDSAPQPSDQYRLTSDDQLPGLILIEKRLLTLLENTPAKDTEKRESLEQTLSTIRLEKAAIELRIAPNVVGATLTADAPTLNQLPPTTAAFSQ